MGNAKAPNLTTYEMFLLTLRTITIPDRFSRAVNDTLVLVYVFSCKDTPTHEGLTASA